MKSCCVYVNVFKNKTISRNIKRVLFNLLAAIQSESHMLCIDISLEIKMNVEFLKLTMTSFLI